MCSPAESHALFPCLPSHVAQKIFQNLSMIDICNAAQASKSLWSLTCQLSSLTFELSLGDALASDTENAESMTSATESFRRFLMRRSMKGMEVALSSSLMTQSGYAVQQP